MQQLQQGCGRRGRQNQQLGVLPQTSMWPEREAKPATWSVTSDEDVAREGGKTSNLECHLRRGCGRRGRQTSNLECHLRRGCGQRGRQNQQLGVLPQTRMWPEREAKPATWSVTSDEDVAREGGKTSNLECYLRRGCGQRGRQNQQLGVSPQTRMWPEREAKPATWSVTSDEDVAREGGKTSNLECHLRRGCGQRGRQNQQLGVSPQTSAQDRGQSVLRNQFTYCQFRLSYFTSEICY